IAGHSSLSLRDALPISMKIMALSGNPENQLALARDGQSYLIYNASSKNVQLDLSSAKGSFKVYHIDPRTGEQSKTGETIKGGNRSEEHTSELQSRENLV